MPTPSYFNDIRVKNADKFEELMRGYEKFSNGIYFEITKIFITLNTALLAFTSPLVSGKVFEENCTMKTLLIVTWCMLGLSIIFGIAELLIEHYFFDNLSKLYTTLALIFNSNDGSEQGVTKAEKEMNLEIQKNFKEKSSPIAFYFQVFFFLSSLLLLIIIFSKYI